jgi:hypothetical protein
MSIVLSNAVRRLGIASSASYVILSVLYVVTLAIGLLSLASQDDPIGDPMFAILEVLIIPIMVAGVVLMGVVYAWASPEKRPYGLMALIFIALTAVVTCSVHFVILTVSRESAFTEVAWTPLLLAFRWPSVVYALDILAWDVFFPIGALFAALVFGREGLTGRIRALLIVSAVLSFAGLAGVFTGDMMVRNIGIIGYALIFPIAAALIGILLFKTETST